MPGTGAFPPDLKEFIASCFDSVGAIEVLLLLRADRSRKWAAEEVSRELRSNLTHVERQLERLRELGLLEVHDEGENRSYSFGPSSARSESLVNEMAVQFAVRRVTVINIIYESKLSDKIQVFSDAFKLRKD
ncbi:MAG TPA: hypothetical protein PL182_10460 [Pseudobdellovibrionaceae bacterium]|nr:hypothetical protein [Pseudobdellovibrionaceae bacterium]